MRVFHEAREEQRLKQHEQSVLFSCGGESVAAPRHVLTYVSYVQPSTGKNVSGVGAA